MLRFFISLFFLLFLFKGQAQGKPIDLNPTDTVVYTQPYGLRVGVDLSRPLTSFFNKDYTGLEFVGDYRLSQNLYLAGELGNEKKTKQEDLYHFTTSGSYLKVGVDYNTYGNWYGEQNMLPWEGAMQWPVSAKPSIIMNCSTPTAIGTLTVSRPVPPSQRNSKAAPLHGSKPSWASKWRSSKTCTWEAASEWAY